MTTSHMMKVKLISTEANTLYDKFLDLQDRLEEIACVESDWLEAVPFINRFGDTHEENEEYVTRLNEATNAVEEAARKMLKAIEFIEQILE